MSKLKFDVNKYVEYVEKHAKKSTRISGCRKHTCAHILQTVVVKKECIPNLIGLLGLFVVFADGVLIVGIA